MTKNTNITTMASRFTMKQKAIAVLLAVALVLLQIPIIGYAGGESGTTGADASGEVNTGTVDIALDLQNAYFTYNGQAISSPATKVTVPAWTDFAFTPAADTGYELAAVWAYVNGVQQTLSVDENGAYIVPASMMDGTVSLTIVANEAVNASDTAAAVNIATGEEVNEADAAAAGAEDAQATDEADEAAQATNAEDAGEAQAAAEAASDGASKTKYSYEDANVKVTATLTDAAAVPDDANFVVTPVTKDSTGYNYDAYMQALNDEAADAIEAGETDAYTEENTLLYDVAFMVQKTDAAGNAIEGETEEFQPTDGSVKINFEFKSAQLTDDLGAQDAESVEVKHLPLTDQVKESTDSTEAATDISAADVKVEAVDATTSVQGTEKASFSVSDFSVFAFKTDEGQKNTWSGSNTFTMDNILATLGETTDYAVYANLFHQSIHLEGNIKVGELDIVGNQQLNQDSNVITRNAITKINVTKNVTGSLGGTFKFAAYTLDGDTYTKVEGSEFEISVPAGQTSASCDLTAENAAAIFSELSSGNDVYIFELNENGDIAEAGSLVDGTYTVSYNNNKVVPSSSEDLFDNYIGKISTSTGQSSISLPQTYFYGDQKGAISYIDGVTTSWDGNNLVLTTSDGLKANLTNYKNADSNLDLIKDGGGNITADVKNTLTALGGYSATLATAKNGAQAGEGSLSVVNLVSTTGNLTSDFDAANFKSMQNGEGISGLLTENSYLLINIDATGYDNYTLTSLKVDGNDWEGSNEELARHVILNFVTHSGEKDADGNYASYEAYTGNITVDNLAGGTVFAPSAKVTHAGGIRGEIIANEYDFTNGSELHKETISKQKTWKTAVSNSYVGDFDYRTSYTGTKTWKEDSEDIRPENLVVTLFADGVATTYKPTWEKNGNTWTYTFTGLPVYNADGSAIHYTAVESTPSGYDAEKEVQGTEYELDQTSLLTVETDNEASEFAIDGQGIGMVVGQKATGGFVVWTSIPLTDAAKAVVNQVAAGALPGFDANNCEYVCDNPQTMAVGDATVAINGDKDYGNTVHVDFTGTAFTSWAYGTVKANYNPGNTDFTNTFHRDIIAVEKVWKDSEGKAANPTVDSITVELNRSVSKMAYPEGSHTVKATVVKGNNTYPVEAHIAADGRATVELAFTSEWDGAAKIASVEGLDGVDYTTTAAGNGSKVATLTIAKVTKDLDFTINATSAWAGLDDVALTGDIAQGEMKTTTEKVKDVTLSKSNNWRVDFAIGANEEGENYEVLPAADADGNPYKYSFSEVEVPGWSTTYTANNEGGITTGVVTITNVKSDEGTGFIGFSGTKNIENRNFKAGDSITFKVQALTDGAPMPEKSEVTITPESGTSALVDFDVINFKLSDLKGKTEAGKATGTFEYKVTESHKIAGVTTDSEKTVKITATENDKGNIDVTADPSTEAGVFSFTNTYNAASTHFEATKNFNDWGKAANFTFELAAGSNTAGEGVETPMPEVTSATATQRNPLAVFGDITFDNEGTYNYTITEKDEGVAGVTYDTTAHKVVVTVTKGSDNKLSAAVTYDGAESLTITNTYSDTSADLKVTKEMSGRALTEADSFGFVLAAADSTDAAGNTIPAANVPMPEGTTATANSASNWVAQFASIHFTKAGTYNYTITEQQGAIAGVTYDTTPKNVTVTVTKGSDNKLSATVAYGEGSSLVVTNTYNAAGSLTLSGAKTLEGKALTDKAFNFVVTENVAGVETTVATGTNDATGKINFTTIYYGLANVGEHTYTVKEVKGSAGGVVYDEHTYTVKVLVTDTDTGVLAVSVVEGSTAIDGLNFTNRYEVSGETDLTATKYMDGRDFQEGDTYSFTVAAQNGAPAFSNPSVTIKPTEGAQASVDFGTAKFTAEGTYTYVVSENAVDKAGVKSDPAPVTVTVTAKDNGKGALDITKTYSKNDAEATGVVFTNTYTSDGTTAKMTATKALTGRDWNEGDAFTFKLADETGKVIDTQTATAENKTVTFAEQSYDKVGTYNYTITEVIPKGAEEINGVWMKDGIAYDGSAHKVQVTVADNLAGKLVATVAYDESAASTAQFTNTYNDVTESSVAFEATKHLSGKELTEGEYSFQLKDANGNVLQTATNVKDGKVSFAPITYKEAGEYNYTIVEVNDSAEGVTYDTAEHAVKVTVTKGNDNKLVASVFYDGGTEAPTFTNTYFGAEATFGFTKYFYGSNTAQAFNFTLTAADENGNARTGEVENPFSGTDMGQAFTLSATAAGFGEDYSAAFDFGTIKYTAAGAYYYTVAEDAAEIDNVDMDATTYLVRVTVADDQSTKAEYKVLNGNDEWTSFDGEAPEFYNNEMVTLSFASFAMAPETEGSSNAEVSVDPTAQKVLKDEEGNTLSLNEGQFTFELVDNATGKVIATAGNAADGKVSFPAESEDAQAALTFTKAGTYTYTIREQAASSASTIYDTTTYTMTVTVTEGEGGQLSSETVYTNAATGEVVDVPMFNNSFKGIDLKLQKVSRLGSEGLEDCTYALWMVVDIPGGGTRDVCVAEGTTDAEGWITFQNVDLVRGVKYYYKEVKAPSGHTVDPYRTAYFSLSDDGTYMKFVEATAEDGWHPAGTNSEYYN